MALTRDEQLVQAIAETLWKAATSENTDLASSRCETYRGLEMALEASLREVYRLNEPEVKAVREIFSDLGPHDSHCDSPAGMSGMQSYAYAVKNGF